MIYPTLMNILIFRTDISTQKEVKRVKPLFNERSNISQWSIDLEDIDNVLRLEVSDDVKEEDIISLVETCGFLCEELPD